MKKFYSLLIAIQIINLSVKTQVVTTDPLYPSTNGVIKVIFNTSLETGALKNYTGTLYAHTGVMTSSSINSDDWKHVKTNWGVNTPETKLTYKGSYIYELLIQPDIISYYSVADTEKVVQLAFVFRSDDAKKQTTNIYIDVFEPGLNIIFNKPTGNLIVKQNEGFGFHAQILVIGTPNPDFVSYYIDNSLVSENTNTDINDSIVATDSGYHWIKIIAKNSQYSVTDSIYYYIRNENKIEDFPANVRLGINYLNDSSIYLALQAPKKKFVFVIGDFNAWKLDTSFQMKLTSNQEIFWLFITHLKPGKEYVYQYFIDGIIKIADPYTDKTCDPLDQYIPSSTYPNLLPYPVDKTTEIASVLQTAQQPYQWTINNFVPPDKTKLVVYEILIRDFTTDGIIKTITDTLHYLKSLGINAIELMPFSEFEGNDSWGYNPSFYFAPDKAYGTKNDYKKFIDECHKNGIAVIMDIVLNHSYGQSPLVRMYFDKDAGKPSTDNSWYNQTSPNTAFSWGYDFNHESSYTKQFVDSVTRYWISDYRVDGFRFDFTKGFTNTPGDGMAYDAARIAILERMSKRIWEYKNNAIIIFEHLAVNTEEAVLASYGILLWGNMNYNYNEATMGWNENGKSNFSNISYKNRGWTSPNLVGYMESHDEERLMYKNATWGNASGDYDVKDTATALGRIELAANFFIPVPGPKMIWMFGELGYDISIDNPCRLCKKSIKWDYFNIEERKRLYKVFSALIHLKESEQAFSSSNFTMELTQPAKSIHITDDDMDVVVLGNFNVVDDTINATFQVTGKWYEYYSGVEINVTNTSTLVPLKPGEFRFYTTKKLERPDIFPLTVSEKLNNLPEIKVFPNPSSGIFSVQIFSDKNTSALIIVSDLTGRKVDNNFYTYLHQGENEIQLNYNNLNSGCYILSLQTKDGLINKELIKK